MALPCQKNCGRYSEGCHKTCKKWRLLQYTQTQKREREKAFLRETRTFYGQIERQWRQIACSSWHLS